MTKRYHWTPQVRHFLFLIITTRFDHHASWPTQNAPADERAYLTFLTDFARVLGIDDPQGWSTVRWQVRAAIAAHCGKPLHGGPQPCYDAAVEAGFLADPTMAPGDPSRFVAAADDITMLIPVRPAALTTQQLDEELTSLREVWRGETFERGGDPREWLAARINELEQERATR